MGYMRFSVKCRKCGHVNRPDSNTRKGIIKTLTGEFSKCRGCGTEWEDIRVPYRPLVRKMIDVIKEEGPGFHPRVHIYEYKGRVPRAAAI